jgi:hypothetical protein
MNLILNKNIKIGEVTFLSFVLGMLWKFPDRYQKLIFNSIDRELDENENFMGALKREILEETGIYLESIEFVDNEEIYAWGTIFKENDKYFVFKPDNTE